MPRNELHARFVSRARKVLSQLYEVTHKPPERPPDKTITKMLEEKKKWTGCRYINGHLYKISNVGRIHVSWCNCYLEAARGS